MLGRKEKGGWGEKSYLLAVAVAKSLQSCPTLCDPIDGSPPGSPVPGILQARTLEEEKDRGDQKKRGSQKGRELSRQ